MKLQYLTPKNVDAFLTLDKKVYKAEYQVGKEATLRRLQKNSETDLIVMDEEEMVGYLSLCPIPSVIFSKITKRAASEEEIESASLSYKKPGFYNAYLSSIVIDKKRYPLFKGKHLFLLLEKHLMKLRKKGIFIHTIIAVSVTIAGKKTLNRFSFNEIREDVFVYNCLKQGITFVAKRADYAWVSMLLLICNKENHWGSV